MAYDEGLARRIMEVLGARRGIAEKKIKGAQLNFIPHRRSVP